ncbi:hypothetical protein [Aphanizomenon flos-aquae]|jgi:hypothetical protein|uniref:Uncharacterized protein n=1 Tax=Aphanizomenon flos-aquae FACHB-1040 TaxID=2692887 RepID=A0ABR8BTN8_APHFL|nr:hypothetical protein [Aphanizomenon flos-aquae]ALB40199.1 hypothetical protein AA650_06715 [Anabaena sp. WA102]MBD2276997.1 hypothetical protein [Aphanizomenon flos-aquae FACHB-1040]OBQ20573.1 MAG: hypothetical protein AN486_06475 [Anabaena sp. AL93]
MVRHGSPATNRAVLTALNILSLPPWNQEIRGTFVMYFQRDNYRFKFPNSVRIMFCSKEPPIFGVMLADAYGTLRERQCFKSFLDLQHCFSDFKTV